MSRHEDIYEKQGFGNTVEPKAPFGLLIVDFVNGFADPQTFGGGNIAAAIETNARASGGGSEREGGRSYIPELSTRMKAPTPTSSRSRCHRFSHSPRTRPRANSSLSCSRKVASW